MNEYTACELAYKNGYEKGYAEGMKAAREEVSKKIKVGRFAGRCTCGRYVFADENYCPKCRQALDWSEE